MSPEPIVINEIIYSPYKNGLILYITAAYFTPTKLEFITLLITGSGGHTLNGFFPLRGLGHFFSRRDEVSNITFPDFDLDETDVGGELTWSPANTIGRALVWKKTG